jgi:hypothetical protein
VIEVIGGDVPDEFALCDAENLPYPVKYDDLELTIGDEVVDENLM